LFSLQADFPLPYDSSSSRCTSELNSGLRGHSDGYGGDLTIPYPFSGMNAAPGGWRSRVQG
ncbi:MAG: hypothetical protein J4G05_05110, partial [Chlorobi bacterium]|nr:hypothetical protein [Chlorobiota bacterium]